MCSGTALHDQITKDAVDWWNENQEMDAVIVQAEAIEPAHALHLHKPVDIISQNFCNA